MRGRDVESKLLNEPRQPGSLAFGNLQDEPRQGRGVDDRMLQWAFQAPTDEPGVEGVVTVLDQHGALSETQEGAARVAKFRCADQHRTVDVMAPVCVRVDRRTAVHEGVKERERAFEPEALSADLQDEERGIARGLHVEGDELRLVEPRLGPHLGCINGDLFPRHQFHGSARFEEQGLGCHLVKARARRAQSISSLVTARSSRAAAP
jgi:hypothetical protein